MTLKTQYITRHPFVETNRLNTPDAFKITMMNKIIYISLIIMGALKTMAGNFDNDYKLAISLRENGSSR
jgi:hypothetical protein